MTETTDSARNRLKTTNIPQPAAISEIESEEDNMGLASAEEIRKLIPQASYEDYNTLRSLPPRLRNQVLRIFIGLLLIGSFTLIVYSGPIAVVILVCLLQLMCFKEVIHVGYVVYRSHNLPYFRVLSWYFLFAFNYFLHGDVLSFFIGETFSLHRLMHFFVRHHPLVSFVLYLSGLLMFILSLVRKHYTKQFTLFAYTHVALMIMSCCNFQIKNILNGLVWFLLPVLLIIVNDIMSYFVGFHFGRTPLIKLSPKKTWEGFIGGFVFTLIFAVAGAQLMSPYDFLVCPVDNFKVPSCRRSYAFELDNFQLPALFGGTTIAYYHFVLDAVCMGLFASLIAPFGGFFASGFKRAFRLKDFGQILPGHGGVLDRFDCQFMMGAFVYVYYNSFINCSADTVYRMFLYLTPEEQLSVYSNLTDSLTSAGYLN